MTPTVYRPKTPYGRGTGSRRPRGSAGWRGVVPDPLAPPRPPGLPPQARRSRLLLSPEPCFVCSAAASSSSSPPQNHGSSWFLSYSSDFTVSRPTFSNFMALGRNKHMALSY